MVGLILALFIISCLFQLVVNPKRALEFLIVPLVLIWVFARVYRQSKIDQQQQQRELKNHF